MRIRHTLYVVFVGENTTVIHLIMTKSGPNVTIVKIVQSFGCFKFAAVLSFSCQIKTK